VVARAVGTAMGELKNLMAASHVYKHALRAVAMGYASWSNVKRAVGLGSGPVCATRL